MALADLRRQAVHRAEDARTQLFQPRGPAGVVDAADHVQAAGDLRVVVAGGLEDAAGGEYLYMKIMQEILDRVGRRKKEGRGTP